MSETETPKTKKPRGPAKSPADKLREIVEAKRKQVAKLGDKRESAEHAALEARVSHSEAERELKRLEAALGEVSA